MLQKSGVNKQVNEPSHTQHYCSLWVFDLHKYRRKYSNPSQTILMSVSTLYSLHQIGHLKKEKYQSYSRKSNLKKSVSFFASGAIFTKKNMTWHNVYTQNKLGLSSAKFRTVFLAWLVLIWWYSPLSVSSNKHQISSIKWQASGN